MDWIPAVAGIVIFLALIVFGVRIAFSGMIAGLIILLFVYGNLNIAGMAIASIFAAEIYKYSMTVLPLFIFMGFLAYYSGMGEGVFRAARSWFGRLPGGLAIATTMGCASFGAICGSTPAATAVFGKLAIPEMEKAKYHWSLSIGSVAASGTLADLIPPSTMMVVYGVLAEQSIGKLLIAGFIPGIVSALIYAIMMFYRSVRNPKLGPAGPSTTFREKLSSLKGLITVFIVMFIIIGGIYGGVFTPTEAGAVSALAMLIAGFITMRRFDWPMLKNALIDTTRTTCMILVIVVGVKVLTTALISTGAIQLMVSYFEQAVVHPYLLLLFASIIYIILGAFVGVLGMMVMTVPFFVPILMGAGFDPIWLGVIVIKFCELGMISPPIGMNVFLIAQISGKDVTECFKAIAWFLAMDLLTILVLIAFPQIVLFLPSMMTK